MINSLWYSLHGILHPTTFRVGTEQLPFCSCLETENSQQLFIFFPLNFLKLIYLAPLHDCPDVAVTRVLLDYVVFQSFHWNWVFMVLGAAEVT